MNKTTYLHFYLFLLLLPILFFPYSSKAQDFDYSKLKRYKNLADIKQNPDSVFYIQMKHKGLKEIPPQVFACRNLIYLDLSFNKIKSIPPEIGKLTHLRVLNLGNNKINNISPEIKNCKELRTLILRFNELTQIPPEIGFLPKLVYLNLAGNYLNILPETMKNLQSQLKYLDMRVITLSRQEQADIEKMLPNTKIFFSQSCNCMK
jgi:Leucine-rich repeat (LRR) protein